MPEAVVRLPVVVPVDAEKLPRAEAGDATCAEQLRWLIERRL